MPFNFDPNSYTSDPAHFSEKAKAVLAQMSDAGTTKIRIDQMSVGNGMHYVLYFHRRAGLVAVLSMGDGEFGFQGLTDSSISIKKMLIYLDNIGQTGPDAIPEMQLIRGELFGIFQGTADELRGIMAGGNAPARMFAVADAASLPRFEIDFFQEVLRRVDADSKASALDMR